MRSEFLTPTPLVPYDDELWIVEHEIQYMSEIGGLITIPEGYITDLASVPKPLWPILPPFGRHSGPAIVHDWIYGLRGQFTYPAKTRKECDQIFREAMLVKRVHAWKRNAMYWGVRAFGWSRW